MLTYLNRSNEVHSIRSLNFNCKGKKQSTKTRPKLENVALTTIVTDQAK